MKKNIGKILAVILVVALLATVLCACNAESYQKKLEKKGYAVTTATSNDKESTAAWTVTAINKNTGEHRCYHQIQQLRRCKESRI